jgi:hypothetical protein
VRSVLLRKCSNLGWGWRLTCCCSACCDGMYRRRTAAACSPVLRAPQPALADQSFAMQLQTLTARAQAPPCALHSRCSARQSLQPAGPATAPCRRVGTRGGIRAAATAADGSLRTPHSGYHWDGTPRRCEWPARLRQLPGGPVSAPAYLLQICMMALWRSEVLCTLHGLAPPATSASSQPHHAACALPFRCAERLPPSPPLPSHAQSSRAGTSR